MLNPVGERLNCSATSHFIRQSYLGGCRFYWHREAIAANHGEGSASRDGSATRQWERKVCTRPAAIASIRSAFQPSSNHGTIESVRQIFAALPLAERVVQVLLNHRGVRLLQGSRSSGCVSEESVSTVFSIRFIPQVSIRSLTMRILVTGATGFVGFHLVPHLAVKHEVYSLCRNSGDGLSSVRAVHCDLAEPVEVDRLPKNIDAVIHLAQSRQGRDFPGGTEDMFAVNLASTGRLLQYALRWGVKHFILASTGSVYSVMKGATTATLPSAAASYYAASKLAAELIARAYHQHMSVCTLRLFTPYGPGQYDRLVSDLIDRVSHDRPVLIVGDRDGLQFHPTFIVDVVAVIDRALDERWDGTYDVANAQGISIRQAAEQIGVVVEKMPTFQRQVGPEQPLMLPNLSPLRARFPIGSFCPFERGLRETIGAQRRSA